MSEPDLPTASDVVTFWREAGEKRWFARSEAFDSDFRSRFIAAHEAAAAGQLATWSQSAEGSLALLILFDQFPRNAFRGEARMYATDAQARSVARAAIDAGFDQLVEASLRPFFYLPLMHSESLGDQQRCVTLCQPLDANTRRFAAHHRDIVERFGRFPHRNDVLGRDSTVEEKRFLAEGGFKG